VTDRENFRQKKFMARDLSMGKILDDRAKLANNQSMRNQSSSVRQLRDHELMKTEPNEQIYRSQSNPRARGRGTYDRATYFGFDKDGVEQTKTTKKHYETLVENTTRNYDHHRSASNPKERNVKFEHTANDFANGKMPDRISEKKHFSKAIFKPKLEQAMRSMEQKKFDQIIASERVEYKRPMFNNPYNKTAILEKFKKDKEEGATYPNHKKMK